MSSRVNLNDNTKDRFEFSVGGFDYDLKYPTLEGVEPIRELVKKMDTIENDSNMSDEDKSDALDKVRSEMETVMYDMIVPVGHDTPIKETIAKQPFPVVKAFNKMMNEQLSAE